MSSFLIHSGAWEGRRNPHELGSCSSGFTKAGCVFQASLLPQVEVVQRNRKKQHISLLYIAAFIAVSSWGWLHQLTCNQRFGLCQFPDHLQSLSLEVWSAVHPSGEESWQSKLGRLCRKLLRYNINTRGQNEVVQMEDNMWIKIHVHYIYIYSYQLSWINKTLPQFQSILEQIFFFFLNFIMFITFFSLF